MDCTRGDVISSEFGVLPSLKAGFRKDSVFYLRLTTLLLFGLRSTHTHGRTCTPTELVFFVVLCVSDTIRCGSSNQVSYFEVLGRKVISGIEGGFRGSQADCRRLRGSFVLVERVERLCAPHLSSAPSVCSEMICEISWSKELKTCLLSLRTTLSCVNHEPPAHQLFLRGAHRQTKSSGFSLVSF